MSSEGETEGFLAEANSPPSTAAADQEKEQDSLQKRLESPTEKRMFPKITSTTGCFFLAKVTVNISAIFAKKQYVTCYKI